MKVLENFLDTCRDMVKSFMRKIASALNVVSKGKLTPNTVTLAGLAAHAPIAYLIAVDQWILAAVLLVIFGLFDSLDGALARLQKRDSSQGMLLDASTDRIKEVMLYCGAAYYLAEHASAVLATVAVAACGASLVVSYVKAKGEMAVSDQKLSPNEINRLFQAGLLRFEVRMALLALGLLTGQLTLAIIVIAVGSSFTVAQRLTAISRKLASEQ